MKILIISYYSFPLNAVASYRIKSFCEGFSREGADVTLLTRHWGENFKSWEDILSSDLREVEISNVKEYREIRLPYQAKRKDKKHRIINKLYTFKSFVSGNLQKETDAYSNFKKYALQLLVKENDFDLILVSAPPNNLVRLASYLNKKTKVPYVVDFRDFLNDQFLMQNPRLDKRTRQLNNLTLIHVKRWLRKVSLVITVSPKLKDVFENAFKANTILALNGFEQKFFSGKESLCIKNDIFTIRHIGTAYQNLDFSIISEGILRFKKQFPNRSLKVELVAIRNSVVEKLFEDILSSEEFCITKVRIPKEDVVEKTINTDVLILACNVYDGVYGTKLFDYLASGSHILLSPPDNSVVEELIRDCENGSVANTSEEVFNILDEQYNLWLKGENKTKINAYPQYARENIAIELYAELKKVVDERK